MRDFLIIKHAYERKSRMLVLSAYFTHMDLAKPLREHLEHPIGLDHGCIDLTSVADIKAERRARKHFKQRGKFLHCSPAWLTFVHVLDTQRFFSPYWLRSKRINLVFDVRERMMIRVGNSIHQQSPVNVGAQSELIPTQRT